VQKQDAEQRVFLNNNKKDNYSTIQENICNRQDIHCKILKPGEIEKKNTI